MYGISVSDFDGVIYQGLQMLFQVFIQLERFFIFFQLKYSLCCINSPSEDNIWTIQYFFGVLIMLALAKRRGHNIMEPAEGNTNCVIIYTVPIHLPQLLTYTVSIINIYLINNLIFLICSGINSSDIQPLSPMV